MAKKAKAIADLVMPLHDTTVYPNGDTLQAEPEVQQPEAHFDPEILTAAPTPETPEESATFLESVAASRDPAASIASALVCIGQIYNDAGLVSVALSKHLPTCATQPELHSFLHRMQTLLGEFRNAVTQVEISISDSLHDAIETVKP